MMADVGEIDLQRFVGKVVERVEEVDAALCVYFTDGSFIRSTVETRRVNGRSVVGLAIQTADLGE